MPQLIKVANKEMAANFAKQWTHNGVAIFMDATHHQFAADFCNIIITSFIEQKNREAAAQAAKQKVVIATD
jgi:hypothetical protein